MTAPARTWRRLHGDRRGQATVEWTLLLVCFALPMIYLLGLLLSTLTEYYRMVTFLQTLPFP